MQRYCGTCHQKSFSRYFSAALCRRYANTLNDGMPPEIKGQASVIRSLLRSLLREATYLPDPAARFWVAQKIRYEFRRNAKETKLDRISTSIKYAKRQLSFIRRANLGRLALLLKIIRMTYGRTGERRHDLLNKYLHLLPSTELVGTKCAVEEDKSSNKSPWKSPANPRQIVAIPKVKGDKNVFDLSDNYARLRQLLKSQSAALGIPRRLLLEIPLENAWFRPMPLVRIKNKVNKWLLSLLAVAQPPLPFAEWESLRLKAWGMVDTEIPIKRRVAAKPTISESQNDAKVVIYHADDDDLRNPKWLKKAMPFALDEELRREKIQLPERGRAGRHKISRRLMQRMWTSIFHDCPVELLDEKTGKSYLKWGYAKNRFQDLLDRKRETSAESFD